MIIQHTRDNRRVSKSQVLKFVEMQFALADTNEDGELDVEELRLFLSAIAHPNLYQQPPVADTSHAG